jgi:hypothetical protein
MEHNLYPWEFQHIVGTPDPKDCKDIVNEELNIFNMASEYTCKCKIQIGVLQRKVLNGYSQYLIS